MGTKDLLNSELLILTIVQETSLSTTFNTLIEGANRHISQIGVKVY
jgi:hypothetical protein